MSLIPRYLERCIAADLERKMVFVAGPRQVGTTTMARQLMIDAGSGEYYSWDNAGDRRRLRTPTWPAAGGVVVLDELHKLRQWKRWLKGEYDRHGDRVRFLVTGSARLDVYRRGGDSLQGRYHHYRLHPFSCAEIVGLMRTVESFEPFAPLDFTEEGPPAQDALSALLSFGGFPEPLLAQSTRGLRRWRKDRVDRFFREDIRDLETIRDLSSMMLLSDLLTERVGTLVSVNALREDLDVGHYALSHWIEIFERLYHVVRVGPFATRTIRTLKKMPKLYLWDTSLVADAAARLENVVALHLAKLCHFLEDAGGHRTGLHFLRDTAGHEVDFLVSVDKKPWFAVEVKTTDRSPTKALHYFRTRLKIPHTYQIFLEGNRDVLSDGVRCMPAAKFLTGLV